MSSEGKVDVCSIPSTGQRWLSKNLRISSRRNLHLAAWSLLALACCFLAYTARMHEITHDAFHEMSLFRESLVLGSFPTSDVFAYTPTVDPSVHHEWGTGAILYFATVGSGLGLLGLSLLKLLLMAALWLMLYRVARMRGAHPILFACMSLIVFPLLWVGFATVRAQLFTLVFIAVQLWMQELDWRGRRAWVLPWLAMLILWLNLHAGFVVGLGMVAFHTLERIVASVHRGRLSGLSRFGQTMAQVLRDTWHLFLLAPAAVMALPLNPYGWKYIPYLIHAISMPRPLIREWKPIWHTYAPVWTILALLVALALFAYAQRCNPLRRLRGAAFLALAAYMSVKHIRHGSIFAVTWIAFVPAWISRTALGKQLVQKLESNQPKVVRVCQATAVLTMTFALANHFWLPSMPPAPLYSTACYPTGAVEFLKEHHFRGNLMTPFHVGAYVSWELFPSTRVSFDGRYEVAYQPQVMEEHNRFLGGEDNWWTVVDKYPTDAILVHKQAPVHDRLVTLLTRDKVTGEQRDVPENLVGWYVAYCDDSFSIIAGPHIRLPQVHRIGQPMQDGAWKAFSSEHAHWNHRRSLSVSAVLP
ncbi:MAG: hypothetical protein KDB22_02045 [Planctomycetales bacterium]|nr:hypothetical protein [Planctomycetales bacterium]